VYSRSHRIFAISWLLGSLSTASDNNSIGV
jgi:hypothetical protein